MTPFQRLGLALHLGDALASVTGFQWSFTPLGRCVHALVNRMQPDAPDLRINSAGGAT